MIRSTTMCSLLVNCVLGFLIWIRSGRIESGQLGPIPALGINGATVPARPGEVKVGPVEEAALEDAGGGLSLSTRSKLPAEEGDEMPLCRIVSETMQNKFLEEDYSKRPWRMRMDICSNYGLRMDQVRAMDKEFGELEAVLKQQEIDRASIKSEQGGDVVILIPRDYQSHSATVRKLKSVLRNYFPEADSGPLAELVGREQPFNASLYDLRVAEFVEEGRPSTISVSYHNGRENVGHSHQAERFDAPRRWKELFNAVGEIAKHPATPAK